VKVFRLLFRAGISLLAAFILCFPPAVIFFGYSSYGVVDRAFLVFVPTFAIAWLIFQGYPIVKQQIEQTPLLLLAALGILAASGAAALVLPHAISKVYSLGAAALAMLFFAMMLPAASFIKRFLENHSIGMYALGFLLSVSFAFFMVGFLNEVIETTPSLILLTGSLVLAGNVAGSPLFRRAARSLRSGFLSKPLNLILSLSLPIFLAAIIFAALKFPAMLLPEHISVPSKWMGWFIVVSLLAGTWGTGALLYFESRWESKLRQTKFFNFVSENLPGIYAGGMFFLINLVIARALNHPALTANSVLFESDAGPWLFILGSPTEDVINRSVHPLVLITLRPLVRFVALFTTEQWQLAPLLVVAAMSGLCVLMAWRFVERAASQRTHAFIFAIMLGATAAHLVFGSLTDTYIFGVTSLIFFLLLIQAKETRFTILIPAGLLVFGITVTNIIQSLIGLLCNQFGFKRLMRYGLTLAAAAIALTVFTSVLYPNRQTFFFVPGDIAFETNFVKPVNESPVAHLTQKAQIVSRTLLLYGVIAPKPLEIVANKPPRPTIDLKTYDIRKNLLASYKGWGNLPLALWLILLAGAFFAFAKGWRSSPRLPLMLGLLGSLAFNFLLHMNYGTELFLYSSFWTYALILFTALALAEFSGKAWLQSALAVFLLILMVNNFWFIFTIFRALAPFYASA